MIVNSKNLMVIKIIIHSLQSNTNPLEAHNFHKAAAYGLDGGGAIIHVVDNGFNKDHSQFSGKSIEEDPNGVKVELDFIGIQIKEKWLDSEHGLGVMGVIGANKGDGLVTGWSSKCQF